MPRAARLAPIPFGWYYYQRTSARGREIVCDHAELRLFRDLLNAALKRVGADLFFIHVDPDVVHLVMHAGETSLLRALGSLFIGYARRINRRRNEHGALFKPHAQARVFRHDTWLLPLGRYIHHIAHPREVPLHWNSEAIYRQRMRTPGLNTSLIFRAAARGSRDIRTQDAAYRAFFEQPPSPTEVRLIECGSPEDSRILGDPSFVSEMLKRAGLPAQLRPPRSKDPEQDLLMTTTSVIDRFRSQCKYLSSEHGKAWLRVITPENARSKSRKQPLPMVRALIAEHVLCRRIATLGEIEEFFGCGSGSLNAGVRRRQMVRAQDLFNQPIDAIFNVVNKESYKSDTRAGVPAA